MKTHLLAWGHETLPDLDITGDDIETAVDYAKNNYPYISVALLEAIPRSVIARALKEQFG